MCAHGKLACADSASTSTAECGRNTPLQTTSLAGTLVYCACADRDVHDQGPVQAEPQEDLQRPQHGRLRVPGQLQPRQQIRDEWCVRMGLTF